MNEGLLLLRLPLAALPLGLAASAVPLIAPARVPRAQAAPPTTR